MAQSNDSVITGSSGTSVATQLAGGKELQVVVIAGDDGHLRGTKDSYAAVYRLAAETAATALSAAFTANQNRQLATIHHAATATKTCTLRRVELYVAATAASVVSFDLVRITSAPATGNPAITSVAANPASGAAEVTCLALPTTAGTQAAGQLFSQEMNLGANTALTATWPPDPIVLWPAEGTDAVDTQDLQMRPGVLEGYAVVGRSVAAVTLKYTARFIFTEH